MLEQACIRAQQRGLGRVAVNLSARQFLEGDLSADIESALTLSGLPGHALELEITESLMMRSPQRASALLHDLKGTGVRVVLDDFGTGYSSLSYLHNFPIDGFKLDRSFVAALENEPRQRTLIRSIVDMGKALEMDVTAEGVETHEQYQALQDIGVPLVQGYLFGRPTPFV